ncbi:hypothetical protein B0H10DRAFT_2018400, partial [Mycena sp. CBHHK59/15]
QYGTSSTTHMQNPIPATFLREAPRKYLFAQSPLPTDRADGLAFPRNYGSPDPEHGRQLNGMGGGEQGIDVEYTFVQVGIRDSRLDYSGNCGNLSSNNRCSPGRGDVRAVAGKSHMTVRCFNTNTQKVINTTPRHERPSPAASLDILSASTIVLDFAQPSGARTGSCCRQPLPWMCSRSLYQSTKTRTIRVSYVDATNPTVFVALPTSATLSMGVLHRAVPMTVGLYAQQARRMNAAAHDRRREMVRIKHPSGVVDVGAEFPTMVPRAVAKVVRTGRR